MQDRQDQPVVRSLVGPADLAPEDADLVPQGQDLDVPRPREWAAEEDQVSEHAGEAVENGYDQRRLFPRGGRTFAGRILPPATGFAHPTARSMSCGLLHLCVAASTMRTAVPSIGSIG